MMNPDRDTRRMVFQSLKEMGFTNDDITLAIKEHGYDVERCANFLVHAKSNKHKQLFVGMDVWYYSVETNDWIPANVISISKQLVSLIFDGHDFRWLEKDSEHYTTQTDKPEPLILVDPNLDNSDDMEDVDDNEEYTQPKNGEIDYDVLFPESVLGLELYSDEDGYNCIVGRCVSQIARQKVQPGSQIIQVNNKWLANYKFEEIRDAVKRAAQQPPLQVKFRIKKTVITNNQNIIIDNNNINSSNNINNDNEQKKKKQKLRNKHTKSVSNNKHNNPYQYNMNVSTPHIENRIDFNNMNNNEIKNENIIINNNNNSNNNNNLKTSNKFLSNSLEEEKRVHPQDDGFVPHMTIEQAELLRPQDTIDHRDDVGRFLLASIVDKRGSQLKIHYEGWNSKWDMWCDYKKEIHRFAAPKSISRKPNTRCPDLKIRDYVDINPSLRHQGWRVGQIRRLDRYSGQAQIVYKEDGQEFLYWAHLNNPKEIAQFMTKAEESLHKIQQKQTNQNHLQQEQYENSKSRQLPPTLRNKRLPPKPPRKQHSNNNINNDFVSNRFDSIVSSKVPSRPLPNS